MVHFYHNGDSMQVPVDKLKEANAEMLEDVRDYGCGTIQGKQPG